MAENNIAASYPNEAEEMEIDLVQAVRALFRHIRAVILCTALGAVAAAVVALCLPVCRTADTLFFVDHMNVSTGVTGGNLYTTESRNLNAAGSFADTFGVLLTHGETLAQLIDTCGLDCTAEDLAERIEYETVGGQMIKVTVTADDGQTAVSIAETLADIMPEKLMAQVEGVSASVVEAGRLQEPEPLWAVVLRSAAIGALVGLVVSGGVVIARFAADRHIYTAGYLARMYPRTPLLTALPDAKHAAGGALEEAYKLLRTYIMFPGGGAGRTQVIGVTSAVSGEGKTETAVALGRVLAQADRRVLLLEGDMRHPHLAEALGLQDGPDFAAYLAKDDGAAAVQTCSRDLDAAVCRAAPEDPSELVSSARMCRTLEQARGRYDYVLIDLPAVMEAADAVAVSRMADGMLVLVRAGRADQDSLAETMRRLAVAEGRVLGFVFNGREQTRKKP